MTEQRKSAIHAVLSEPCGRKSDVKGLEESVMLKAKSIMWVTFPHIAIKRHWRTCLKQ